jgi:hypothetical protein
MFDGHFSLFVRHDERQARLYLAFSNLENRTANRKRYQDRAG